MTIVDTESFGRPLKRLNDHPVRISISASAHKVTKIADVRIDEHRIARITFNGDEVKFRAEFKEPITSRNLGPWFKQVEADFSEYIANFSNKYNAVTYIIFNLQNEKGMGKDKTYINIKPTQAHIHLFLFENKCLRKVVQNVRVMNKRNAAKFFEETITVEQMANSAFGLASARNIR